MYNRHLPTFIQVADRGSFAKAADALYISSSAVIKQINLLESHLGVKLFQRSFQGLELTEAGQIVYDGAQELIELSNRISRRAKETAKKPEYTVRIGTSPMNPMSLLLEGWLAVSDGNPGLRLEVVPFYDSGEEFRKVLSRLGRDIDLIAGAYGNTFWGDNFQTIHLTDLPSHVILSRKHRLAQLDSLTPEDLAKETLLVIHRDFVRLERLCPSTKLKEVNFYDVDLFNRLATSNDLLFGIDYWAQLHPQLVSVPVEWDYPIHYGLLISKTPSKATLFFVEKLKEAPKLGPCR